MNTKRRLRGLSVALLLLGTALLGWSASWSQQHATFGSRELGLTVGVLSILTGLIMMTSTFSTLTFAVLRLDLFLPFLRKKKKRETLRPAPLLLRTAQRVLPKFLFADRVTGRPGVLRRILNWLGKSVLSSPIRRLIQAACLLLFLVLFFHVCWPYSAKLSGDGNVSAGWRFVEIEQATGNLRFERDNDTEWPITNDQRLHAVEAATDPRYLAPFDVVTSTERSLSLQPVQTLTADQVDAFLIGQGPWSFYDRAPNRWPSHYADDLERKEFVPAESFLAIDPLVGISTSIAARSWVWSLACAGIILAVCVLIPRGFCGYLCPLGTLIDLFDWAIAGRVKRFRVPDDGWWVHIKYYLLTGIIVSACFGVLISGVFAAIPIVTRAMLFLGEPLQNGVLRRWDLVPAIHVGHLISIALFFGVLGMGFLRTRFWCKYVCPSGAVFSLGNLFRVTERKVEATCINCNKCVEICPFDAIKPDFTTRVTDCTLCQTCGGVCPTHAIKFVDRWNSVELKVENDPPTGETAIGRRGFLSVLSGTAAAVVGGVGTALVTKAGGARLDDLDAVRPVRPPGSVPEREFLQMCIRCGECFKACPNNVLQAEGFQQGLEGLWAPLVNADWAGCDSSCNACGQVCPTGAIRALPLEEKKVARMGLAIVNEQTCLPFAGKEDCDLCVVECDAAGYHAIEFQQVHTAVDPDGSPIEGSGFLAPVVLADKCVGCGLCQTRCNLINVKERGVLSQSAIIIEAGDGKEDRILTGSYVALRDEEKSNRDAAAGSGGSTYFIPPEKEDKSSQPKTKKGDSDPFGTNGGKKDGSDEDPFGTGTGTDKSTNKVNKKKSAGRPDPDPFGTGN